jgi:class 3 adenylate cyclase/tetratricopeptide (TPR) repeat protein
MGTGEPADLDVAAGGIHTFLIADVRGYTRFTVTRGDEAALRLTKRFEALARQIVEAHSGRVLGTRGDEVAVVFASARQALRAAVALQAGFAAETAAHPDLPLPVGVGLDAGEALPVGDGNYRGAALNLAARLCALAAPGEVLASEGVVHLARRVDGLAYQPRGAAQLKGFTEPMQVVCVLPADAAAVEMLSAPAEPPVAHPGGNDDALASEGADKVAWVDASTALAPSVSALPSLAPMPLGGFLGALPDGPLIAREAELARLLALLEAVAGGAGGRLVLLAGEPGIGKTRLAQEVTLAARNRGFLVTTGRCYEPQEAVAYYPFLEALSIAYAAAPGSIRADVPQRWAEVVRLLPDQPVGVVLGGSTSGAGRDDQPRLFWQVAGFLQALAAVQPVALLLDDLHWADGASLDLLQHLARHARAAPLLLLGTYRDMEVGRQHALEAALRDLARDRLLERVALRRLDTAGTQALLAATLGEDEVTEEFATLLHSRTEGNPFFTQEVLRALVERGDVFQAGGSWDRKAVEAIAVPESVRAVIGQRLEHLAPETQAVLREASVLGQTFQFAELRPMSGRAEEESETALVEASAAGLVRESGPDGYTFHHALIQQALYAELPARRRRRLHRAAGEALEQLPTRQREVRVAELAWHFLEADEGERALPYTLQTGDQAEAVYAHAEAERHYRAAAELACEAEDHSREAEALEKLGGVLHALARYDDALAALERAVDLYGLAGDNEARGQAIARIGWAHAERGTRAEGIAQMRDALSYASELSPRCRAALSLSLANLYYLVGSKEECLEASTQAMELAREIGDEQTLVRAMSRRADVLSDVDTPEGEEALEDVVVRAEVAGDLWSEMRSLIGLALLHDYRGELELASQYYARILSAAQRLGDPTEIAFALALGANPVLYRGLWQEVRTAYEQAEALIRQVPATYRTAYILCCAGWLDLCEGREETAVNHLQEALAVGKRCDDLQIQRLTQSVLAEADLVQGRPAAAAQARIEPLLGRPGEQAYEIFAMLPWLAWAYLEQGNIEQAEATLFEGLGQAPTVFRIDLLLVQARLCARQGKWSEGKAALEESLTLCRGMPWLWTEAKTLFVYGQISVAQGNPARARNCYEQALAICERLGEGLYRPHIERALAKLDPAGG